MFRLYRLIHLYRLNNAILFQGRITKPNKEPMEMAESGNNTLCILSHFDRFSFNVNILNESYQHFIFFLIL